MPTSEDVKKSLPFTPTLLGAALFVVCVVGAVVIARNTPIIKRYVRSGG